jgi:hypothetical protein
VALTEQGENVFRLAGRVHLRAINQHIGETLPAMEMAELRRIMTKLAVGINATPAASDRRSAQAQ